MENVGTIEILLTIILGIMGFMMSRLYKAIDNLYQRTENLRVNMKDKLDLEQTEEVAERVAKAQIQDYVIQDHK